MPKGIYERVYKHAHNFKDLTGQRFGKRTILGWHSTPIYRGHRGSSLWLAKCDCGTERAVTVSGLRASPTCGCEDAEAAKRSGETERNNWFVWRKFIADGKRAASPGVCTECGKGCAGEGKQIGGRCKVCYNRAWRAHFPKQQAEYSKAQTKHQRVKNMGVTPEMFDARLKQQDNKCAICGAPLTEGKAGRQADHDHKTGEFRGILCAPCNRGLGMFNDDIPTLFRAIVYLAH